MQISKGLATALIINLKADIEIFDEILARLLLLQEEDKQTLGIRNIIEVKKLLLVSLEIDAL